MQIFTLKNFVYGASNCIDEILIDPALPDNFFTTRMDDRSKQHLEKWFGTTFVLNQHATFKVWCLDGQFWDKPSCLGEFENLEHAVEFAKNYTF